MRTEKPSPATRLFLVAIYVVMAAGIIHTGYSSPLMEKNRQARAVEAEMIQAPKAVP